LSQQHRRPHPPFWSDGLCGAQPTVFALMQFEAYSKRIRDSIRGVKADEAMGADVRAAPPHNINQPCPMQSRA
jgi:hypothetical protein